MWTKFGYTNLLIIHGLHCWIKHREKQYRLKFNTTTFLGVPGTAAILFPPGDPCIWFNNACGIEIWYPTQIQRHKCVKPNTVITILKAEIRPQSGSGAYAEPPGSLKTRNGSPDQVRLCATRLLVIRKNVIFRAKCEISGIENNNTDRVDPKISRPKVNGNRPCWLDWSSHDGLP